MCNVSPVTCDQSPVPCHQSPVTCHLSPVTSHLSPVTNCKNHSHRHSPDKFKVKVDLLHQWIYFLVLYLMGFFGCMFSSLTDASKVLHEGNLVEWKRWCTKGSSFQFLDEILQEWSIFWKRYDQTKNSMLNVSLIG